MSNFPTGIICALNKELRPYLDRLTALATHTFAGLEIIEGEIAGKWIMLTNAGIGKVNASIAATLLCDRFKCELIAFPGLPREHLLRNALATSSLARNSHSRQWS